MVLFVLSFVAGVLTVAAPCILPLLPVIVGGTIARDNKLTWYRPLIIAGSLAASVVVFTLLLKASTQLLGVPDLFWKAVSGGIVTLFGLNLLFPEYWEKLFSKVYIRSNKLLGASYAKNGAVGDILIGVALGPIFSSCSPTYALIVATVLPISFAQGFIYLLAYAIGLAGMLLIVTYAGQSIVSRMGWLSNPKGMFRKITGIIFILVGISLLFGWDKNLQTYVLEKGWYDPIRNLEMKLDR